MAIPWKLHGRETQQAGRRSRHPKKGQMSRTRAGRRDFTTKKSSTKFNRRGHRQSRSARGVKRRPYSRRKGGSLTNHHPIPAT